MQIRDEIKQQYIDTAVLSSKALAEGDYKTANKQAKIQQKIFKKIEEKKIDANILVELLNHEYIAVSTIAAIDLLRIKYETHQALKTLEKIVKMDEKDMGIDERQSVSAAKYQLESWRKTGAVSK